MIQVLIVDNSAVARECFSSVLRFDSRFGEIRVAASTDLAIKRLESFLPHVIVLNIEMPEMTAPIFLRRILERHSIPVVIAASRTERGIQLARKAKMTGAASVFEKPRHNLKSFLQQYRAEFCNIIEKAAKTKTIKPVFESRIKVQEKHTADVILSNVDNTSIIPITDKIIVAGASTGGTDALLEMICSLPKDSPGMVVTQHMPGQFTRAFAERLDELCSMRVKEAKENDMVLPGQVLIAPGDKHMLLKRSGQRYYVQLHDGPPVSRHKPSVDVLFRSAAQSAGKNAIGVILTGMGDDGASGMLEMKHSKAFTIAQDEKTSVVFGMPKKAIDFGGVDLVLPLKSIADAILKYLGRV